MQEIAPFQGPSFPISKTGYLVTCSVGEIIGARHSAVSGNRIFALPEDVAAKIRSSVGTPSFGSILCQLIYNALDAEATSIVIKFDIRAFALQVRDNGKGMTFVDLHRCGQKSFTSKLLSQGQLLRRDFATFGFKGEALASIADFCHLEIETRSRMSPSDSGRKVIREDESICVPRRDGMHSFGTTVSCRDLFFNRPVIRKMLASSERWDSSFSATAQSHSSAGTVDRLLSLVRAISIAHPGTSFTVYEASRFEPLLNLAKASTHRAAFSRLFRSVRPDALFEVDKIRGRVKVSALLCSPDAPGLPRNKEPQLVYVNGRPAARCPVHKRLNAAYKSHWNEFPPTDDAIRSGGLGEGGVLGGSILFPQRKRRRTTDGATSVVAPSRRYPCFFVQITCPPAECCFHEQDESCVVELACWDLVLETVDALAADFFAARTAAPSECRLKTNSTSGEACEDSTPVQAMASGFFPTAKDDSDGSSGDATQHAPWSLGVVWGGGREGPFAGHEHAVRTSAPGAAPTHASFGRATHEDSATQKTSNCEIGETDRVSLSLDMGHKGSSSIPQNHSKRDGAWLRHLQAQSGWEAIQNEQHQSMQDSAGRKSLLEQGSLTEGSTEDRYSRTTPTEQAGDSVAAPEDNAPEVVETEFVDAAEMRLIEMALQTAGAAAARTKGACDAPARFQARLNWENRPQDRVPPRRFSSSGARSGDGNQQGSVPSSGQNAPAGFSAGRVSIGGLQQRTRVVFDPASQGYKEVTSLYACQAPGVGRLGQKVPAAPTGEVQSAGGGQALAPISTQPTAVQGIASDAGEGSEAGSGQVPALLTIGEVLEGWNNPVVGCATGHRILELGAWGAASRRAAGSVSRDALRGAEVVGQAFDKFVVIRAGAQLVVVDQHAADERVRLEEMEVRVPVRGAGPAQWRSACTGMHGAVLRPR